jgi:hypothetical protein
MDISELLFGAPVNASSRKLGTLKAEIVSPSNLSASS